MSNCQSIIIKDISVKYGRVNALRAVSGIFNAGSLTAIAGPNGAGKSTLLKVIAGVVKPSAGSVEICADCQSRVAYLPQTAYIQRDFPIDVQQAVCTGFWPNGGEGPGVSSDMKALVASALAQVGMDGFEKRQISDLSGGQFQRMLFARVIVQDAPIILLDEPFAAVDAETTARLIRVLMGWHKQGRTIVCVLHDLLMIQKYFPDSFVLAGKCLGHGHTHALLEQKLLSFDLDMAELCPGTETEEHHHHV